MQDALAAQPFRPFTVVSSSGRAYEVRHPENVKMLRDALFIAYFGDPAEEEDDELPDRFTVLSWLHITALEPAAQRAA